MVKNYLSLYIFLSFSILFFLLDNLFNRRKDSTITTINVGKKLKYKAIKMILFAPKAGVTTGK